MTKLRKRKQKEEILKEQEIEDDEDEEDENFEEEEDEEEDEEEVEEETCQIMLHNVPVELRQKFKLQCMMNGQTMKSVLVSFMEEYIEN